MCKTVDKAVHIVYKGQKNVPVNIDFFDLNCINNPLK